MKTLLWVLFDMALLLYSFVVAKVDENTNLIKQLGDGSFIVREKASSQLADGMTFKLYLEFRHFKHEDPEVANRIWVIRRSYENKIAKKWFDGFKPKLPLNNSQYPWICLQKSTGTWDWDCGYIKSARLLGAPQSESLGWMHWRVATKIWLDVEVCNAVSISFKESQSEKDFFCNMDYRMESIKGKILHMISMEDNWRGGKKNNPLRKIWGFDSFED